MSRTKTTAMLAFLILAVSSSAMAGSSWTYQATTQGAPTWTRLEFDGSAGGPTVRYHDQAFTLSNDASCYVTSNQDHDGFLHLFSGSFNPGNPTGNTFIDGNDDGLLFVGTSHLPDNLSTRSIPLSGSMTYHLVTSGFGTADWGQFENTVHCGDGPLGEQTVINHGSCTNLWGNPDGTATCLYGGRFYVDVWVGDAATGGWASVVPLGSDDSGLFYFFNAKNWEMIIKVLNGCAWNNHYWVYGSAGTDREFHVYIEDTVSTATWTADNIQGQTAQAFNNIQALAACP